MDKLVGVSANEEDCESSVDELHALIFSVKGVRFGADMEQIKEVADPDRIEDVGKNIVRFNEEFSFPDCQITYQAPRILFLKSGAKILVDEVEEVRILPIDCIRPLPRFLEKCRQPNDIWGVALVEGEIILLLDFLR
ncbi:MAG: hypothetical protein HOJ13_05950 [Nitrospina sp.]|jgi:chemotaxis signal transduction protein|nr:hypothetical protein [Nitrospina sp.]